MRTWLDRERFNKTAWGEGPWQDEPDGVWYRICGTAFRFDYLGGAGSALYA
jgi:hypothetical protein